MIENAQDLTLEELRPALAPAVADSAIFDGWGDAALDMAADIEGVERSVARLAFKGRKGPGEVDPMALIVAWIDAIDSRMKAELPRSELATLKIRERIRALVAWRLEAVEGQEEALRRAMAVMAMPQNAAMAMKTGWRSADLMWRLAGDTATDYNHYTKRAILAALYGSVLSVFVGDESEGKSETLAFLDRRIDNVMQFEKVKGQFLRPDAERFSVTRFLGRLRYPAR